MPLIDSQGNVIDEMDHRQSELLVVDGTTLMRCRLPVKRQRVRTTGATGSSQ
ncbi:MAG: hypothetical protein LBE30_04595 [Comamonas sp.]|jgi:hypothetical protein|nr:hypothetical protein [Comamonas sp.]